MRKLFLVRHAKSSWDSATLSDIERPLNERGNRDAPFMGKLLKENSIIPDVIISSPAVRAYTTAKIIAAQIGYPAEKISISNRIYEAGVSDLLKVINSIDNGIESIMIVGHNPGLTYLHNHLTNTYLENMPTCSMAGIELNVNTWKDVEDKNGNVLFYEFPKKYFK